MPKNLNKGRGRKVKGWTVLPFGKHIGYTDIHGNGSYDAYAVFRTKEQARHHYYGHRGDKLVRVEITYTLPIKKKKEHEI